MVKKWVTSLVLVLAIAGSAVASVPMHFGGRHCSDMDCCMTEMGGASSHNMREEHSAPTEKAEGLFCFLNCSDPMLPGQTATVRQVSPFFSSNTHPAVQAPATVTVAPPQRVVTESYHQNSQPIYIRHLALLI
ncbi:MAG: hypothetical protein M3362_15020 [Acidobacteriota bacterium]|nr:hypothetical protein [Acidobacteriota bacterium]